MRSHFKTLIVTVIHIPFSSISVFLVGNDASYMVACLSIVLGSIL